jgi:hypothetical protein
MTSKLTAALKAKFLHGRQTCCVHSARQGFARQTRGARRQQRGPESPSGGP